MQGQPALEDFETGSLTVPRVPVQVLDGKVYYESEKLAVSLSGVSETAEGEIVIR